MCFLRYVQYFPEMRHAIKSREDRNSAQSKVSTSSSSTDVAEERVVVGFGPYKNMSFFDLFHSPEDAHKKYVKSILQIHISHPGGQMDKLKNYIQTQQRVAEEKANDETLVQLVDEIEQRVIGSQSSSRVSTEELHVPPPSPSIHLEASSAPEKVIQYFTFTMF